MLIDLAERRLLPDALVRSGIRRLLRERLQYERKRSNDEQRQEQINSLFATGPIAIETDAANQQHYEVPTALFQTMLGPHLKYSSCLWEPERQSLATAEEAMLRLTCERAECADGQHILELGCGWGSLTMWLAEHYPSAEIVAITNSRLQKAYIEGCCQARNLGNVEVRLENVAELQLQRRFDRVISIEMFEHMRNWKRLLENVRSWLDPGGKAFLHTFCHEELFYPFADEGKSDWMARHFFTGGVMPSYDLLDRLDIPFQVQRQWRVSGTHYAKTCRAWLANLDAAQQDLSQLLSSDAAKYGGKRQLARWRMFVMACEELFDFDGGQQWFVSHALLATD